MKSLSENHTSQHHVVPQKSRNKFLLPCVLLVIISCYVVPNLTYAQSAQDDNKQETSTQKKDSQNKSATDTKVKADKQQEIDWGDWNTELLPPEVNSQFGVGINGKLEAELSKLDKSNLLQNPTGVAAKEKTNNTGKSKKQTDLKKTMAELEALEAKVKKEIEDDSEF